MGDSYKSAFTGAQIDSAVGRVLDDNLANKLYVITEGNESYITFNDERITFAELRNLLNTKKEYTYIFDDYNGDIYVPAFVSRRVIYFNSVRTGDDELPRIKVLIMSSNENVSFIRRPVETATNKVNIISEESTDEQYPSASAIYRLFNGNSLKLEGVNTAVLGYNTNNTINVGNAFLNDIEGYSTVRARLENVNNYINDVIIPPTFTLHTHLYAYEYDGNIVYSDSSSEPTHLYNSDGSNCEDDNWEIDGTDIKYQGNTATYTSTDDITEIVNPAVPTSCGPAISDDGIITGFSGTNYLTDTADLGGGVALKFIIPVTFDTIGEQTLIDSTWFSASMTSEGFITFTVSDGVNSFTVATETTPLEPDVHYYIVLKYDTNTFESEISIYEGSVIEDFEPTGGELIDSIIGANSDEILIENTRPINIGGPTNPLMGSIDLNEFVKFIDGRVYIPYLVVPCHQVWTGSKVVEMEYGYRAQMAYFTGIAETIHPGSVINYSKATIPLFYVINPDEELHEYSIPRGEVFGYLTQLSDSIGDIERALDEIIGN